MREGWDTHTRRTEGLREPGEIRVFHLVLDTIKGKTIITMHQPTLESVMNTEKRIEIEKKVGRYWVFHHNHADHGFSHLAWAKSEATELGATISKVEPRG